MKVKSQRITVIAAYIIQIVFNSSAGNTVGEQSDRFQTLVAPAGYTFAIWGLIFAATLAYTVYQALPRTQENRLLDGVAPWATVAFLASGVWIPLFTNDYLITANVIMVVLLASLTGAVVVIINHKKQRPLAGADRWLVQVPLSIYLGWITVATVANFALTLTALEWGGLGISPTVWAVALLVIAALIAGFVVHVGRGNVAYALTLVWALAGIMVASSARPVVLGAAAGAAIFIVAVLVFALFKQRGQDDGAVQRTPGLT